MRESIKKIVIESLIIGILIMTLTPQNIFADCYSMFERSKEMGEDSDFRWSDIRSRNKILEILKDAYKIEESTTALDNFKREYFSSRSRSDLVEAILFVDRYEAFCLHSENGNVLALGDEWFVGVISDHLNGSVAAICQWNPQTPGINCNKRRESK